MSNINQLKVENVTYDIEDNATRTASRVLVTDANGKIDESDVTTSELNVLDGITATTAELNVLDGITSDTNELNLLDGKTSDCLRKITFSTSEPTSGQGSNGDVWFVYSE